MKIQTILSIEDSIPDQFLTKVALNDYDPNIKVIEANDGQEAINILNNPANNIDLILLDLNMPGMGGFEFLETYKQRTQQHKPVVVLTSSSHKSDIVESQRYSYVVDYMFKAPTKEKIQNMLNNLLQAQDIQDIAIANA